MTCLVNQESVRDFIHRIWGGDQGKNRCRLDTCFKKKAPFRIKTDFSCKLDTIAHWYLRQLFNWWSCVPTELDHDLVLFLLGDINHRPKFQDESVPICFIRGGVQVKKQSVTCDVRMFTRKTQTLVTRYLLSCNATLIKRIRTACSTKYEQTMLCRLSRREVVEKINDYLACRLESLLTECIQTMICQGRKEFTGDILHTVFCSIHSDIECVGLAALDPRFMHDAPSDVYTTTGHNTCTRRPDIIFKSNFVYDPSIFIRDEALIMPPDCIG